jgi:DNA-binding CsgD family transcriptional regulator
MALLSDRDVRALLELIHESHALADVDSFRKGILPPLRRAVPSAVAVYNELEQGNGRSISLFDPPGSVALDDPAGTLVRLADQNPLSAHYARTRDGRAYKLSDFITRRELHRLDLYREGLEPLGLEHQMAFALPSRPSLAIGIALNRASPDFTERDRTVLNLARPHLIQSYGNAATYTRTYAALQALERGFDAAGEGVVLLTPDDRIEEMTPSARRMLSSHLGAALRRGARLPGELAAWLGESRDRAERARGLDRPAEPMVIRKGDALLLIRYLPGRRRGDHEGRRRGDPDLLLVEEGGEALRPEVLRGFGLTPRQAEILRLVALGEPSKTIAGQLGITLGTVHKHLEHIFERLGVTSRAAAAATVWAGATAGASGSVATGPNRR